MSRLGSRHTVDSLLTQVEDVISLLFMNNWYSKPARPAREGKLHRLVPGALRQLLGRHELQSRRWTLHAPAGVIRTIPTLPPGQSNGKSPTRLYIHFLCSKRMPSIHSVCACQEIWLRPGSWPQHNGTRTCLPEKVL